MAHKQTRNKFSSQMIQPRQSLFLSRWKKIAVIHFQHSNSWVATPLRIQLMEIHRTHYISTKRSVLFLYHLHRSKQNQKQWTLNFRKSGQARTWVQIAKMLIINRSLKIAAKTYLRITPILLIVWNSKIPHLKTLWWITRLQLETHSKS